MNIEHLTLDEILRTADPVTPLEKKLFEIVQEATDRAELAEEEVRSCGPCCDCHEKDGEIDELEDEVKALRKLCDENEIDHSEV